MNNQGIKSNKKKGTPDRSDTVESIKFHPKAKEVKKMIDQNLANINPITKIVEPAFNTINFRKSARFNKAKSLIRKVQLKALSNPELLNIIKKELYIVNANPVVEEKKIMMEKHIFARELYMKNVPDVEIIFQNSNNNSNRNTSLMLSPKKGRKLRKEYTLPPKPIKGTAVFSNEIKKYEAAKHYLINQKKTTLAKTCKEFNVSVPTLITYMDKSRVDAFIKTGKYSGNSAKREKRNVKNQYHEKDQANDKWTETIKNLISEAGALKFYQDNEYYYFNNPFCQITKGKKLQNHLAASKEFMKKIELKLQNGHLNPFTSPITDKKYPPSSIFNISNSDFPCSSEPNLLHSSLNPKALQPPAYTCRTTDMSHEVSFSYETNFQESQQQVPGVTQNSIKLDFSRPSSSYFPNTSSQHLSNPLSEVTDWSEISPSRHVTTFYPKETKTLDFDESSRKVRPEELNLDLECFAVDNNKVTNYAVGNIQQNTAKSSGSGTTESLLAPPTSGTAAKDENNPVLL